MLSTEQMQQYHEYHNHHANELIFRYDRLYLAMHQIGWCSKTYNPQFQTGCTKCSPECLNCYAEDMAIMLKNYAKADYYVDLEDPFEFNVIADSIEKLDVCKLPRGKCVCKKEKRKDKKVRSPYRWKKPQIIFTYSLSDIFHENAPLTAIKDLFQIMNDNPRHIFLCLTKRPHIAKQYENELKWTDNIWLGTTIGSNHPKSRQRLRDIKLVKTTKNKFISVEPLIESVIDSLIEIGLQGIRWVITGGESNQYKITKETKKPLYVSEEIPIGRRFWANGTIKSGNGMIRQPGWRYFNPLWALEVRDLCQYLGIPFYHKQNGGHRRLHKCECHHEVGCCELDGKLYTEYPEELGRQILLHHVSKYFDIDHNLDIIQKRIYPQEKK